MIQWKYLSWEQLQSDVLYDIIKLRLEVFVVEQNCPYQDCDEKDKVSFHLLGYENNQLIAYCRIIPEGISYKNYCAIGRVVNHASVRNKGYGKILMQKAIELCKRQFEFPIKISAQAYLQKFYESLGFEIVSEPYLEDDIPHYAMVLKD